jgi:predicted metal-dependent hydrolase
MQFNVVRRPIKNLHLGVYPPNGHVRVDAPLGTNYRAVRLAVVTRIGWLERQQARFESQLRQSGRRYVSGETHFFLGTFIASV